MKWQLYKKETEDENKEEEEWRVQEKKEKYKKVYIRK